MDCYIHVIKKLTEEVVSLKSNNELLEKRVEMLQRKDNMSSFFVESYEILNRLKRVMENPLEAKKADETKKNFCIDCKRANAHTATSAPN